MKQYSEYKDSGISWIGEIPSHWKAIRIKFIGSTIGGLTYSPMDTCSKDEGVIVLRSSNIQNNRLCFDDNVYVKKVLTEKDYIKQGDLLICSRNGSADLIGKCAIIDSPIEAAFGAFMMVLRPIITKNSKYVYYISQVCIEKYKCTFKTSTINQLTNSLLGNIYTPYAYKFDEQQAIVAYLDGKVAKIDKYIATAEKKIVALDELKQVTIADAVTHGINPNAPMKNSGIPWIGMVPEHWEVKTLRAYIRLYSEKNHADKQLLSITREQGVITRDIESKEENHNYIPDDLSGYKLVEKGDFAINKMKSWQGSYGVSNYKGIVSPAYYVCKLEFENKDFFSKSIRSKAYVPFFN